MMGMPPHQMTQGPPVPVSSASIPVKREKKTKENGSSVLVPASVAVKAKK